MNIDIAQELHDLAEQDGVDADTRSMAESLSAYERERSTVRADKYTPDDVLPVDPEFAELYSSFVNVGRSDAARSHITIVGQVRDCAGVLPVTFMRLAKIVEPFADWGMCIVENDSSDATKAMLSKLRDDNPGRVALSMTDYNWPKLAGFEAERVQRYAKFRNEGRLMSREHFPQTDYVLVVDFDAWGGWSVDGILNGIAWFDFLGKAACMASLSLFQHEFFSTGPGWGHYDTWALRVYQWTNKLVPWKTFWLPPPGCEPIPVLSAFGAAAIYRPEPYWQCQYESIDGDIEHAGLHRNMIQAGWEIYLNPAQRTLMHWLTEESRERRHDGD